MYLPDTKTTTSQIAYSNMQCSILNVSVFWGYYAVSKSNNILTNNLFRCHTRALDGCVVSRGQHSFDSNSHIESASSNKRFGRIKTAW